MSLYASVFRIPDNDEYYMLIELSDTRRAYYKQVVEHMKAHPLPAPSAEDMKHNNHVSIAFSGNIPDVEVMLRNKTTDRLLGAPFLKDMDRDGDPSDEDQFNDDLWDAMYEEHTVKLPFPDFKTLEDACKLAGAPINVGISYIPELYPSSARVCPNGYLGLDCHSPMEHAGDVVITTAIKL